MLQVVLVHDGSREQQAKTTLGFFPLLIAMDVADP
jgi:hypothetical protein